MTLALYRKYRPGTFAEVKGQEHVTEPLRQALRTGRVNHAYLFSGPRGCGKTSSARILARSLNCEKGPTPDPCGECESCVALAPTGPGHLDVIEIDAASHGGVDDARDLRERAFFAPVSARFKIYIIDEAHMVTREGFNALLKLVEEPPPHLKFVFATTEPDKVIGTIKSRTHHYPFRLMPPATLRRLMEEILDSESVPYEPAALPLVVRAGAGSARDSLSILDQLLAGADDSGITYARAVALLGYTDADLLDEVVDGFARRDGAQVFQTVNRVIEGGHDPRRFAMDLLERFRDLVVLANVPDAAGNGLLDRPDDELERLRAQAGSMGPAELTRAAEVFNAGLTEMRGATSPRLLLELMCARVLLPAVDTGEASLLARLERLERQGPVAAAPSPDVRAEAGPAGGRSDDQRTPVAVQGAGAGDRTAGAGPGRGQVPAARGAQAADDWPAPARPPDAAGADDRPAPVRPGAGDPAEGAAPAGETGGAAAALQAWPAVLEAVKQRQRATWSILNTGGRLIGVEGNVATLGFDRPGTMKGFLAGKRDEVVAAALGDVFGGQWRVEAVVGGTGGGAARAASGGASGGASRPPAGGRRSGGPGAGASAQAGGASATAAAPRGQTAAADEPWPDTPPPDDYEPPRPSAGQGLEAARSAARAAAGGGPRTGGAQAWPDEVPGRRSAGEADPGDAAGGDGEGLMGLPLIQRELGGHIIGEIDHG